MLRRHPNLAATGDRQCVQRDDTWLVLYGNLTAVARMAFCLGYPLSAGSFPEPKNSMTEARIAVHFPVDLTFILGLLIFLHLLLVLDLQPFTGFVQHIIQPLTDRSVILAGTVLLCTLSILPKRLT